MCPPLTRLKLISRASGAERPQASSRARPAPISCQPPARSRTFATLRAASRGAAQQQRAGLEGGRRPVRARPGSCRAATGIATRVRRGLLIELPYSLRYREGRFSAERDKSSRNELSGWTGRGRQRMTSMMRTYGGAQPGPAPQALGQCGSASDPLVTLSASYSASSACRLRKAPPRQLSASGAASVFQREQGDTPPTRYAPTAPYAREQPLATAGERAIRWRP